MKIVRQIIVEDIPIEDEALVVRENLVNVMLTGGLSSFMTHNIIGDFANHSFVLNSAFDWTIGKDADGTVILIPLRK